MHLPPASMIAAKFHGVDKIALWLYVTVKRINNISIGSNAAINARNKITFCPRSRRRSPERSHGQVRGLRHIQQVTIGNLS